MEVSLPMMRGLFRVWIILVNLLAGFAFAEPQTKELQPPGKPDSSREPVIVEWIRAAYRFESDGTGSNSTRTRVLIQTEGALQSFGQIVVDYDADFERLTVKGRVIKPDGSVSEIPESAVQDLTSPVSRAAPVYSDIRQKHLVVP